MLIDVNKIKEQAEKELREERTAAAAKKIKAKLIEIEDAKTILANLERELDDIQHEITQGN